MRLTEIPEKYAGYPQEEGQHLCRVIGRERGLYRIADRDGETAAELSGRLCHEATAALDYPAVGDYVLAERRSGTAVICRVLERSSLCLRRAAGTGRTEQVVAANVDTVFLCMSLNQNFNLRRLERYLSAAWESGSRPVVVLTKADLCAEPGALLEQARQTAAPAAVLTVSAREEGGWRELLPYLAPGQTVAFLGSSGVGKSTLVNCLLGEERLETGGIRTDDRGRHTTTRRELLPLPGGAAVIDTPGMRELGMWDAGEGLRQTFADIELLAAGCRFSNCRHRSEPGCRVQEAVRQGSLDPGRLAAYEKLAAENAYAEDAAGYAAAREKKFREIAKYNKSRRKGRE